MNSIDLLKYLPVVLASAVKFVGGPLTGFALKLHWLETALCTVVGMMLGVMVVTYVGKGLQLLLKRWSKKPKRRFTSFNRMAVRTWKRFGIIGIAFMTPLLFTPIGGTAIAVAFRVPRHSIFLWMLISGTAWSLIFSFLIYRLTFIQEWFK
ncbi:hypothetical protein [Telluribacter sp. SYSU D00476]|uniref:hypothetical protein n=1 Tax=Telluribacter sp. SYSU D00476 TaxID=2811430 RepID=UPI001FF58F60|nr:hypothetical protein [Telluribacter sp. SYSU D00476]